MVAKEWDYHHHARYYGYRPNYHPTVIDLLAHHVKAGFGLSVTVADIGAGTGNLTLLLAEQGFSVLAVEPCEAMRQIGVERTLGDTRVSWIAAEGVSTTLVPESVAWVAFGSSFNVMDRKQALDETNRILKPKGLFSCLWNHRDLEDAIQKQAEQIVASLVPNYHQGVRREDQLQIIRESGFFEDVFFIEAAFEVTRTLEDYILAWKSVKNPYWDLGTAEGLELFETIALEMQRSLPKEFAIRYFTRCWGAQKKELRP